VGFGLIGQERLLRLIGLALVFLLKAA